LLPLLPRAGVAPKRIILRGVKGAAPSFHELAAWPLHEADGRFTAATESVLRDAAALPLDELPFADLPLTDPSRGR
jgi:hypothetical protein